MDIQIRLLDREIQPIDFAISKDSSVIYRVLTSKINEFGNYIEHSLNKCGEYSTGEFIKSLNPICFIVDGVMATEDQSELIFKRILNFEITLGENHQLCWDFLLAEY